MVAISQATTLKSNADSLSSMFTMVDIGGLGDCSFGTRKLAEEIDIN